jgi:hypothetical protein
VGQPPEFKIHNKYRMLIIDPPATAGGTDIYPSEMLTFEAKPFTISVLGRNLNRSLITPSTQSATPKRGRRRAVCG